MCQSPLRTNFNRADTGNRDNPVVLAFIEKYGHRPRLLDFFSGAGGAAMGYHRAGFEVIGVDIKPQPHYPFEFHQEDALTFPLDGFDAYHASPPCQFGSKIAIQNRTMRPGKYNHPNLIPETRIRLQGTGKPYVIENVRSFCLITPVKLTGSWFGLDVKRDRYFECNFPAFDTPLSKWQRPRFRSLDKRRAGKLSAVVGVYGHINYPGEGDLRKQAMGIDWMSDAELTQAIPPAYTEYIGKCLMEFIKSGNEIGQQVGYVAKEVRRAVSVKLEGGSRH